MSKAIPRPEHPNPQWERSSFVNLNGEWDFAIDNCASGQERGFIGSKSFPGKITLPFCPESQLSGIGNKDFMLQVWYKKILTFTEEELTGKRVIFHVGAADFKSTVYVNGKTPGLPHVGGFTSFEYDITALLTPGDNVITIRCYDDTRHPSQPLGKQSAKYASFGCNYTRTTGIWQTVWYEIVPATYVKYAKITPDAKNSTVSIECELCGEGDLKAEAYFEGKKVGEATKKSLSVTGNLEIQLSETHLWELGDGALYDLVITFGEDVVKSYFGLRHIEMKDGKFYLNGRSVFQRLILDQGFYPDGILTAPTEAALIRDIQSALDAGFNGARLHQKVFEPRFLYNADKMGYMVWGEYGSWGIDHSDLGNLATFLPDWIASVKRDYNHPSIIGWCPLNETWDYSGRAQDPSFLRVIYEQTKLFDPTRPCIDTSGNYHVVTDIFDVHNYEQDPVKFNDTYKTLAEGKLTDRHSHRQTWRGEPVFISEYGGTGYNPDADSDPERKRAWSYGSYAKTLDEFYERYRGLTHAILDNPYIFGFCYTQLTDVEQEVNGLYDYYTRDPKFDMSIIKEINSKKAAVE